MRGLPVLNTLSRTAVYLVKDFTKTNWGVCVGESMGKKIDTS